MKRILFLAVMFNFVAFGLQAQDAAGPELNMESNELDYGVIEHGSDPYRVFSFTNTGNEPLIIKSAKGSCGCTVPTYPTEPIGSGESAEIKVRYDTNRVGKFTKTITLTTNDAVATHVLRIKGEVKPKTDDPAGVPASTGGF